MSNEIKFPVVSEDRASENIRKAAKSIETLEQAIVKAAKAEQQAKLLEQAKTQLAKMTDEEKKAVIAASEMGQAHTRAASDAEKAAERGSQAVRRVAEDTEKSAARQAQATSKAVASIDRSTQTAASNMSSVLEKAGGSIQNVFNAGSVTDFASAIASIALPAGVAATAIGAIGAAASKSFEIGKEGAVVLQTAKSFETLLSKIGAAPDLLDQLRTASRGTVDDMKLMSSTATLLAGTQGTLATALANSLPQLMEIAKAANKLNPLLGDTTFMFDSLALGIKRGSPMILDNLGLTLKIGEANEKYAKSLGKTAEQLTSEETKIALLNATLAAGATMIEQAGGKADSATDSFARMDTAIKNAGDAIKAQFAPAVSVVANAITGGIQNNKEYEWSWTQLIPPIDAARQAIEAFGAGDAISKGIAPLEEVYDRIIKASDSYDSYIQSTIELGIAQGKLDGSHRAVLDGVGLLKRTEEGYSIVLDDVTAKTGAMTEAQWLNSKAATITDNSYQNLTNTYKAVVGETKNVEQASADLKAQQELVAQSMERYGVIIGANGLGKQQREFEQSTRDLEAANADLVQQIDVLEGKAFLTKEQQSQLETLRGKLQDNKDKIQDLQAAHDEQTNRFMLNMLQQQLAVDGLTAAESSMLMATAEKWGLVDQGTRAAWDSMQLLLKDVADGKMTVQEFLDIWMSINSKSVTLDVEVNYSNAGSSGGGSDGGIGAQEIAYNMDLNGNGVIGRATGGSVVSGQKYLWNEDANTRPETFVASQNGYVLTRQQAQEALAQQYAPERETASGDVGISPVERMKLPNPDAIFAQMMAYAEATLAEQLKQVNEDYQAKIENAQKKVETARGRMEEAIAKKRTEQAERYQEDLNEAQTELTSLQSEYATEQQRPAVGMDSIKRYLPGIADTEALYAERLQGAARVDAPGTSGKQRRDGWYGMVAGVLSEEDYATQLYNDLTTGTGKVSPIENREADMQALVQSINANNYTFGRGAVTFADLFPEIQAPKSTTTATEQEPENRPPASALRPGESVSINGPITVVANNPQEFIDQLRDFGRRNRITQLSGAAYQGGI